MLAHPTRAQGTGLACLLVLFSGQALVPLPQNRAERGTVETASSEGHIPPSVPDLPTEAMRQAWIAPWKAERGLQLRLAEGQNSDDPWHPLYGRNIRMEYLSLTGRTLEEGLALLEEQLEQKARRKEMPDDLVDAAVI